MLDIDQVKMIYIGSHGNNYVLNNDLIFLKFANLWIFNKEIRNKSEQSNVHEHNDQWTMTSMINQEFTYLADVKESL